MEYLEKKSYGAKDYLGIILKRVMKRINAN